MDQVFLNKRDSLSNSTFVNRDMTSKLTSRKAYQINNGSEENIVFVHFRKSIKKMFMRKQISYLNLIVGSRESGLYETS